MGAAELLFPKLQDFDICPRLGFVASDGASNPCLQPYYRPWEDLVSRLSTLLATKYLRKEILNLPILKTDKLKSKAEWRHAYLMLAMLTQAYVFEDPNQPATPVPPALSEPFLQVCDYWGLQPILSLIGYCLWNWKVKNKYYTSAADVRHTPNFDAGSLLLQGLDNVETYGSFTATQDEKVFVMVPLLVDAEGGCMIVILLDALQAAIAGDMGSVTAALQFCVEKLKKMSEHLQIIHEHLRPHFFWTQIRPCISGSQGMESKGLPDGIVYELSDGQRVTTKCVGASAGQSSLFQFLDHIFGIEHKSEIFQQMRPYMPRKHREFLGIVEQLPTLRQFIQCHPENKMLQTSFHECLVHLKLFRTKHIGLVTRYIVLPARQEASKEGVKGTGGSLPIPFLKGARDETL